MFLHVIFITLSLDPRVNVLPDKTKAPVFGILTNPINEFSRKLSTPINSLHCFLLHQVLGNEWSKINSNSVQLYQGRSGPAPWLGECGEYPFWVENNNAPNLAPAQGETERYNYESEQDFQDSKPILAPDYAVTGCYIYEKVQEMYERGSILRATCLGLNLSMFVPGTNTIQSATSLATLHTPERIFLKEVLIIVRFSATQKKWLKLPCRFSVKKRCRLLVIVLALVLKLMKKIRF